VQAAFSYPPGRSAPQVVASLHHHHPGRRSQPVATRSGPCRPPDPGARIDGDHV